MHIIVSETCANENSSSLFITSNKAGARSRLICSWMWEAVATVACLACVCLAEVVEGWRRRGYQWATAGVPQSQPSTCCYHNWQAELRAETNGLAQSDVTVLSKHWLCSKTRRLFICFKLVRLVSRLPLSASVRKAAEHPAPMGFNWELAWCNLSLSVGSLFFYFPDEEKHRCISF